MTVEIIHSDCLEAMSEMKAAGRTFASIVTDPPYGLGFMNKHWDAADNVAFRAETWKLALDLLEPGGMLAAFGGSRTQHRMACAIEDAGFEIRETALWLYGSGFPKSKALLKPAYEPIITAQKPFRDVASNAIFAETTALIEALLWWISPAKFAELCSTSFQAVCEERGVDPGSVRWLASMLHAASSSEPSDMTAMFNSPETASTFLSIATLWSDILDASSPSQSTFITKTGSSLTTGLRTLNCLISGTTPANIIQAAAMTNGLWWHASTAGKTSSATPVGLGDIQKHSVADSATWNIAGAILSALADIAATCFPHLQVTNECSAKPLAITRIVQTTGAPILSRIGELTPNFEPIILARKPGPLRMLDIDGCRVETDENTARPVYAGSGNPENWRTGNRDCTTGGSPLGRFPANILHDGSDEVLDAFAAFGERKTGKPTIGSKPTTGNVYGDYAKRSTVGGGDSGTAARFFYQAKASKAERAGSTHPTVKPLALMRWVVRLINPKGGNVLDPFAGSGTTGVACREEGFDCTLIERETEYVEIIRRRTENGHVSENGQPLRCDDPVNQGAARRKSRRKPSGDEGLQGSLL